MDFLSKKAIVAVERGLKTQPHLSAHLFPFQRLCVEFGLRMGAAGIFLDTGLGKSEIQLEWCQKAIEATNEKALILTPLAVAKQFQRRAERWGYEGRVIRDQSEARPGINICNYDRLEKLDPSQFGIVALDESSIIKNFTGKTTRALIETFKHHRFKLSATATPAPNDHMELGNQSEFLSVMAANEMLSRFFINDTSTASQEWRLKGHAVNAFWDWMSSWSRMAELPSDLGDKDDGFKLEPFRVIRHRAKQTELDTRLNDLLGGITMSATSLHDVKRQTSAARAEACAHAVYAELGEMWLIWVDTNYEADAVRAAIPHAIEVRGSDSIDKKEMILEHFASGQARILIAKPSQCGFGLDWSQCARQAFVGRSYSYETWYQAVRRCWRFGQKRRVDVHLIVAEGESEIGRVIERKANDHVKMKAAMREAMRRASGLTALVKAPYLPNHKGRLPAWLSAA